MSMKEWVALYISEQGQLTTAPIQTKQKMIKPDNPLDEVTFEEIRWPTKYVGHVQMKYDPPEGYEDVTDLPTEDSTPPQSDAEAQYNNKEHQ